ncbi:hypothetical protein SFRURICE_008817 [Spodoptera frugiperda]|nr:hypothetical protein SFRURICE_008817 [Spodoptera frugiperda]
MIVSILISLVCLCLAYVLLCRWYFPVNEQVMTFPGKWPLIGHAHKFISSVETFRNMIAFGEYSVKIGDIIKFYIGPQPGYDVATVLNKCLDKLFVYKYVKPMVGDRLIIAEVPVWKRSRKVLDLCFKQHILDDYLQLFNERAERFVETIAEDVGQGEVDLIQKITRSVLETSCLTTLGVNLDGKDELNDNYAKALNECFHILFDRIYKPWYMIDAIFNLSNDKRRLDKSLEVVASYTKEIVQLRKKEYLQPVQEKEGFSYKGGKHLSVLDVILGNSVSETDALFTDLELRNIMDTVLVGAFDTTIHQMLYVLVCIGSSSDVQDKIIQEMNKVLGKDGQLEKENLSQMVYLDAVVKEVTRLYPIVPVIGRDVKAPTKLRNVTIPAGGSIVVHVWSTNRNTRYWGPDAEEFRPERWLDSTTVPSHQAAYATFGPGKRGCVGKTYALMYLKATVVAVLRKYRLTADHTNMKLECKDIWFELKKEMKIILITSICVWLAYVLLCRRYFPVNEQVATYPGKWPLIGHVYKFTSSIVVTDPEDVATVLNKCLDKLFVYKYVKPMVGDRLLIAEVPIWKRNRRVLDLCFKQHILDDYLQLFNERAERFVETIAEDVGQGEVDLIQKLTRSVLETSCLTTLGVNLDGKDELNDNYAKALNECFHILSDRMYKPWLLIDAIFNLSNDKRRLDKSLEVVANYTKEIVQLRKKEYLQPVQEKEGFSYKGGKHLSVLDVILGNSVSETDALFTDLELRNIMDTVLVGAFDTTIHQMLYVLVCIGSSSDVQDKIIQEMNKVLGKNGQLEKENLSQMVYLDAVVKEVTRLYPIGPLIGRDVKAPTKLRNVTIPAGGSIVVHVWSTNRNTRYWGPDAEEFRPERWLDSTTVPSHQAAYATFGPGKRGCVGKTYALMYLKATVVAVLRKYRLTADHTNMKLECKVMLKPASGHLVRIEKRNEDYIDHINMYVAGVCAPVSPVLPIVTDPEDVATVVNKCLDKLFVYRFIEPMVGKEMVAADDNICNCRYRTIINTHTHKVTPFIPKGVGRGAHAHYGTYCRYTMCTHFSPCVISPISTYWTTYLQLFNERAERFVETIAEDVGQGEVDLKKKISRSVLETTCRTTLGINRDGMNDINDNYAKAINDCLDTLSDRIYKPWLIVDAVFNLSSDKKKLDKALETIFEFSEKTVLLRKAERVECLQKNEDFNHKGGFKSVLDVILENTITETKSAFTDTQLRNLMDNMLLAAFDTTIYQMNLVLVCIGNGRLKGDNLSQLVYLDAVVKEAIRLYPVGPLVGRTTTTHTKLRNVTIPAGSSVVVHIWGTNRNPRQWGPDAEEFRPERWLDSTMPAHQAAFATFGPGKRGCVGKTYALMYIKATVVSLLRKYKITADHKKLKLECKIMFKPLSGHLIEIEERNK